MRQKLVAEIATGGASQFGEGPSDEDVDDETLKCQLWTLQAVPTHSKGHIDRCQSVETGKQSAGSCSHLWWITSWDSVVMRHRASDQTGPGDRRPRVTNIEIKSRGKLEISWRKEKGSFWFNWQLTPFSKSIASLLVLPPTAASRRR